MPDPSYMKYCRKEGGVDKYKDEHKHKMNAFAFQTTNKLQFLL